MHSFYPLFSWFFHDLGFAIETSETVDPRGVQRCQSARCYPYEIAHGTFQDLVRRGVKEIFVPHVVALPSDGGKARTYACPIAQAVPYYLSAAFGDAGVTLRAPILDMTNGIGATEQAFVDLGVAMGRTAEEAHRAFRKGCERQEAYRIAAKEEGRKALERIEREDRIGAVLVGRPYNAYSRVANMGVPRKFASSGVLIIPHEFLPFEDEPCEDTMYWKHGQMIVKSLRSVRRHPRLFPVFVSNFGCGPDSFLQHFTGNIMGRKPYLYLELDSHTADAGVATRVAAFLDIISGYRKAGEDEPPRAFVPARTEMVKGRAHVRTSKGELIPATHPRVTLAFPSMGRWNTEALVAAMKKLGFNAIALPPVDDRVLRIGKEFTSGRECSPAVFTVGSLISFCRERLRRKRDDEVLLFFMPTTAGPCRFGQYSVYMKQLVEMLEIEDVALFSPSAADGYAGLGAPFVRAAWLSMTVSSLMLDVQAAVKVAAEDPETALAVLEAEWRKILHALERGFAATWKALRSAGDALSKIRLARDPREVPRVLLAGEIFVRSDELSCRGIEDCYADEGLLLKTADPLEWLYYSVWHHLHTLAGDGGFPADFLSPGTFLKNLGNRKFVASRVKLAYMRHVERKARRILGKSGLLVTEQHDIDHVTRAGAQFVHPALGGEAILSAGSAKMMMEDARGEKYAGVVFIGPFNCMPTGVAESLTKPYARANGVPYLTFETDGGPMTPNFQSQMEVHILRAKRYAREHFGIGEEETVPTASAPAAPSPARSS
jgi:predicted nucleotide-binding protein (sugar kinase/HSP70/actin superfamily)